MTSCSSLHSCDWHCAFDAKHTDRHWCARPDCFDDNRWGD